MAVIARWRCLVCESDGIGGMIDCDAEASRHCGEHGHQTVTTVAHTPG